MLFADVIGQEQIKERLRQTVREGRISHAQLFMGPEGCGKLALAFAYAQYLQCEARTPSDACGKCPSCLKHAKFIHPDLHLVFPVVKTETRSPVSDDFIKEFRTAILENPYLNLNTWISSIANENKQGGIFEAESNEIIRKISLKSFEAEYKIMIIWMPERMNTQCANKLLKLLEEPPAKTVFILVTEDAGSLLPTVVSRCQLLKIPPVASADIRTALQKKGIQDPVLTEITHLANGNYLKALIYAGQAQTDTLNFEYFTRWMRLCYKRDLVSLVPFIDELHALGREKQKEFLSFCLRLIRENFMLTAETKEVALMTPEEESFSEKFHPFINEKNIPFLSEELSKAYFQIENNANAKILFLSLSLQLHEWLKN